MFAVFLFIVLSVTALVFLLVSALALVAAWPFDPGRRVVHEISRGWQRLFFALSPRWKTVVEGLEHVRRGERYVIVVNHQSMVDIPMLYWVPLNFRWVSKREIFRMPVFGQFLWLHGDIAIDRGAASAAAKVLHEGGMWLKRGVSVAIFPEGTRSKDGQVHRFKEGAFRLAQSAGVAVLPVVMEGGQDLVRGRRVQWRHTFRIRVLEPIAAETVAATEVRELTSRVQELVSQEHARMVAR